MPDPPQGGTAVVRAAGEAVGLAIKEALAPVQAQCAALDARIAAMAAQVNEIGQLRERVAVTEARSPIPGPAGPPGKDGADGLSVDDLQAVQDPADDRLITLQYKRGDQTKTFGTLRLMTPRYLGTYEQGKGYAPGD